MSEKAAGSAANRTTYTFYDRQNRPTVSVVDLTGHSVNSNPFVDDAASFVTGNSNLAGDLVTQTQYDGAGNVRFTTDPNGNTTETVYDAAGRPTDKILRSPIDVFTASGGARHYDGGANSLTLSHTVYDSNGNATRVTDADGNSTLTQYDARNRAVRTARDLNGDGTIDAGDIVTSVQYDLNGNKVFSTDPNGIVTQSVFDADNRLTQSIANFSTQTASLTNVLTSTAYDKNGNVVAVTDPLGLVTQTTYDELNRPRFTTSNANAANGASDRLVTETRYDADGNIIATVKQDWVNGVMTPQVTSYQFDALGRKTGITQSSPDGIAAGPVTSFTYDRAGDVLTQTDPLNHTTAFAYDPAGRKTLMTQPLVDAGTPTTTYGYDPDGNLISVTDPRQFVTRFAYDSLNRKTQQILPDPGGSTTAGPTTTLNYDGAGNLTRSTDPLGNATETLYDRANRKTSVRQPDPATGDPASANAPVTSYAYDAAGNLTGTTDALGRVTSYAFDALNRKTSMTQPDPVTGLVDSGSPVTSYKYDLDGNLLDTTDPLNHATAFVYDGLNRKISMTQPDSVTGNPNTASAPVTRYAYDPAGNLLSTTDPLNHATSYAYDLLNRKTSMTQPDAGQGHPVTRYGYDADGNLTSVTDPRQNTTTYGYDALNRKTTVTQPDPGGGSPVASYAYDLDGNLVSTTDPLAHVTSYAYDALNRKIIMTQPDPVTGVAGTGSPVTRYGYDADNNPASTTDPRGFVTRYVYDHLNRKIEQVLPNPSGASSPSGPATSYSYDAAGNLTLTVDPRGAGTAYAYDALNRKVAMRQADAATGDPTLSTSPLTSYAYDAAGNLTGTTDPLGHATGYAYDALNRKISMTQPSPDGVAAAPVTSYAYDQAGNVTAITDPMGRATLYAYDALNRKTSMTQPDPATGLNDAASPVTSYAYDLDGNLAGTTDPLNHATLYTYDAMNRKTSMTLAATSAGPSVTTYAYDKAGNLTATTDPLNHATTYGYDALNRKTTVTQPPPTAGAAAPVTTYAYDLSGNLTSLTDPDHNATTYTYDALNRQLTDTNALGQSDSTVYDLNGNAIADTDRDGRTRQFQFDFLNRKTAELWVDSSNAVIRVISSVYDAAGRLVGIGDPDSHFAYTYDALNRLVVSDNAGTPSAPHTVLTESYNNDGDLTAIATNVSGAWSFSNVYAYDALNRQTQVIQSGIGVTDKRANFTYDAAGNLLSIQRYNDAGGTLAIAQSDYVYDPQNQLIALTHKPGDGTGTATLNDYTWTPDAAGRTTSSANSDGSTSYTYDADNQLLSAAHTNTAITNEAYSYDANGNRIASTSGTGSSGAYTTGPDNRLTNDGTYTYTYDAEGNPLIRTTIATGETLAYGWDYRNRLVGLSYQDAAGHVTQQVLYTYDTSDRRISKQVSYGSAIVGQYVFYNNSSYDGYDPNANVTTDAAAIAPDKQALLPGQTATPFNFTNYDKGINGVIIDVTGLPTGATLTAADFGFLAGNTSDPSTWTSTPAPSIVSVFPGAGVSGSDRIELIWSDYTIRNQWLQVTVKADSNTALQGPQVFYFGNLVGETGHGSSSGSFTVNIGDVLGTKFHSGNPAGITSWFDFNRDGQTGIGDVVTVKFDSGNSLVALNAPDQPRAGYEAYVYGPNSSADDLLLVVDSTGAVTHRILEGPQAHMVLADEDTSKSSTDPNRVQWLLGDNQQTVGDQVNDGGTPTDHLVYDSYGNVVSQTAPANAPRFQYTGMQADNESGMLFDFRRYYDPKDGRFISQDPKSFAAGDTNLYRYVGNDPLNRIDPTGLEEQATTDNADAAAQASAAALAQAGSGQGSATPQGSAGWLTLGTGPGTVGDLLNKSGSGQSIFIAPQPQSGSDATTTQAPTTPQNTATAAGAASPPASSWVTDGTVGKIGRWAAKVAWESGILSQTVNLIQNPPNLVKMLDETPVMGGVINSGGGSPPEGPSGQPSLVEGVQRPVVDLPAGPTESVKEMVTKALSSYADSSSGYIFTVIKTLNDPTLTPDQKGKVVGGIVVRNIEAAIGVTAMLEGGGASAVVDDSETTLQQLQRAANRAATNVGPGSGAVYGTTVHTVFQGEVEALNNANLATEQSYINGEIATRGTAGSVRLDVVEGPLKNPTTIYDLKTGSATLTPARIQQIQSHVPGGSSVPVIEVRP